MNTAELSIELNTTTRAKLTCGTGVLERYRCDIPQSSMQQVYIVNLDISNRVQKVSVKSMIMHRVTVDVMDNVCKLESKCLERFKFERMAFRLEMKNSVLPMDMRQHNNSGYIITSLRNLFTLNLYGVTLEEREGLECALAESMESSSCILANVVSSSRYQL